MSDILVVPEPSSFIDLCFFNMKFIQASQIHAVLRLKAAANAAESIGSHITGGYDRACCCHGPRTLPSTPYSKLDHA